MSVLRFISTVAVVAALLGATTVQAFEANGEDILAEARPKDTTGMYKGTETNLIIITEGNVASEIGAKNQDVFVLEIYAPWCGHCQSFASEFKAAAARLDGKARFGVVNADENPELAEALNVTAFPTVKIFGKLRTEPLDYEGSWSADDLVSTTQDLIDRLGKGEFL